MKTLIKLVIAAIVLNGAVRLGNSAWKQYQFRDEVQSMILFGADQSSSQLAQQIVELAEERGLPVDGDGVDVRRSNGLTTADVVYVDPVELFPRYVYPMDWSFKVDARRIAGQ